VRIRTLLILLSFKRPHDSAEDSGNDQDCVPAHLQSLPCGVL
jgi:hypothetical protein